MSSTIKNLSYFIYATALQLVETNILTRNWNITLRIFNVTHKRVILLCCIFRGSFAQQDLLEAKQAGFSDRQLARLIGAQENDMRNERLKQGVKPWVKQVCLVKHVCLVKRVFLVE